MITDVNFIADTLIAISVGAIFYLKLKRDRAIKLELESVKESLKECRSAIACLFAKAEDTDNVICKMDFHLNDKIQRVENKLEENIHGRFKRTTH